MKIAMLTNNYRPFVGGVPISVERQAQELIKLGHQVTVFAPMYESEEKEQAESFREKILEEDKKAPERVVRYRSQKRKMDNGMVYPGIYPAEILAVFERERFDCIHVHHPMFVGPWALWLGRKYGIPVIYTYHTRYEDYLHYLPYFRINERSTAVKKKIVELAQNKVIPSYMRWFCNRCDLVLAPSAGMQQMIRGYGVNTPIAIFPTGLDGSFFIRNVRRSKEIREQYGKGKRHLLVTVSRLEKEKNYGFLLRGIAELKQEIEDDFHLLIIGDGSQKAELKVRASILGIQDEVTFAGNVPNDQVKDYLNASDLFLFASKSETQGIVLAEAMAAGTPVVAVHAIGADDIIEDGVNGFLTEEREEEWAAKAAEALKDNTNSRMKSAALISAENYRSSRLAIYEEMLYNQCGFRKGERLYEDEEDHRERSAIALH
ncbi:MAG TPA: glycosyltransferase [Candidatus Mediterraneibacter surreyensis]|nr:glycosyltransferase [Candidatus Mediterraneibacter surreyensis]